MPQDHIYWLSNISRADESIVGAKAADLGEMSALELPVPNGFVVAATAYYSFIQTTGLRPKLEALLAEVDSSHPSHMQQLAKQAQSLISNTTMPDDIQRAIADAYHHLSSKDIFVAVRASVPDSEALDIAAPHQAMLNVYSAKAVVAQVQAMWASLFTSKSLYARAERGVGQLSSGMAVIVQRMVESESSGIVFSADPMVQNNHTVSIEAIWGLGEPMISGELTPDHYEVDRNEWTIGRKDIVRQEWQMTRQETKQDQAKEGNLKLPVSAAWQRKPKLTDQQIVALAKLAVTVEKHFGRPQDCEWALANHSLYLVQTRPVMAFALPEQTAKGSMDKGPVALLKGQAAAPGMAHGPLRLVLGIQDLSKVKPGEVIVCQATTPDYDAVLSVAAAVITINGSVASHAAAMARELAIPAVVEVGDVAGLLQAGEIVTVDGYRGAVYAGQVHLANDQVVSSALASSTTGQSKSQVSTLSTATKILVNITEPSVAEAVAEKMVDGVGLLRAEYMLSQLGEHPQQLLHKDKADSVVSVLYEGMMAVAKAFNPRPVIYRACDFTSQEYARLAGGEQYELTEGNPLLGYRGAYRYTTDSAMFKLELAALRKARAYYKNIWLMVPFVRRPEELLAVKQLLAEEGLYRSSTFKLYMMVEVPATVFLLDQFIGVGIDGVSLGTNDLTQLMLGVDRNNPRVSSLFDERNEAVMMAIEQVVRTAAKHGIDSSICGQAPSVYPEIAAKLVSWGVTSISVSPESADATRRLVAEAELDLVRNARQRT